MAPARIFEEFPGGVEGFYQAGPVCWNTLDYVSERHAAALLEFSLSKARYRLEYAANMGWEVLTPECEKYPEALRNISDPPAVLYVKGAMPDFTRAPAAGVAGARKATPESQKAATRIGYELAAGGAIVVSGGAVGVDRCAINGALSAMGQVVSVLPVDLSSPYVAENAALRRRIVEQGGALVSEYFSQREPARGSFQARNRIISGMCFGMVLVQVRQKSGSMIYANHAAKQGREVYVYPGPPGDPAFAGGQRLIEEGAIPVAGGEEVLADCPAYCWGNFKRDPSYAKVAKARTERILAARSGRRPKPAEEAPNEEEGPVRALADSGPELPGQGEVLRALAAGGAMTLAELEEAVGIPAGKLLALMTRLELKGIVTSDSGKRYRAT